MDLLHVQTVSSIARWYDSTDGYKKKLPYRAICSISWLGDNNVYIHGMHGKITKSDMRELFKYLRQNNIKYLIAERKGQLVTRDISLILDKDSQRH